MKRLIAFWCIACCLCIGLQAFATEREVVNLNREWTYLRGDHPGAEKIGFDDSAWEHIGLPHSFSIPYFMSSEFYTGYGWYRKTFTLDAGDMKRDLFLEFDGVFQEAEIYVNGQYVGKHRGGYTGFNAHITRYARLGENLLAVRVNNLWQPDIAPRGGEHVFSGGIYRNVRLVKKHPVHITWYGTSVTTPTLAAEKGRRSTVRVSSEVVNNTDSEAQCLLRVRVVNPSGRTVAHRQTEATVGPDTIVVFDLETRPIHDPALWDPVCPNLYTLESELYVNGTPVDNDAVTFGFRWFEWTADKGFFLNGEHFYFHGANVHQDQAGWGDAVTEAAMRRDVDMMKEAGFNMIRGSHYPHSPAFSDACDRAGMMFWSEFCFWSTAGEKADGGWTAGAYPSNPADTASFERNVLQQLAAMIRIHRNHPSIVAWSMCNEPFFTEDQTLPGVRGLLKKMVAKAHELDPTRPAALGGVQRPLGEDRIDLIGDVAGYNGDGARIADFQNPGIPNVVTEYGSTTTDRPGEYRPGWGDLAVDRGWRGRPWRSGQIIWCGFDHGSIFGPQMGKMGIVDYFRLPKRSWYWYRNEYGHQTPPQWPQEGVPAHLWLTASKTAGIRADGTDDVQLVVSVLDAEGRELSNSPDVRLTIVSGPGEFPTGRAIDFSADSDIRIQDGKAAIALRAYYSGRTVVEATSPGLEPSRLELSFVGASAYDPDTAWQPESRPYVRFTRQAERALQRYGVDSPVFVSTSVKGHSAGLAADGDPATYWQPEAADVRAYLTLDVERTLDLRQVKVTFASSSTGACVVEASADNKRWQPIAEWKQWDQSIWSLRLETPVRARFVRFSFPFQAEGVRPKLAEVEVEGYVAE